MTLEMKQLDELAAQYPKSVTLCKNPDLKTLMKGMGRVQGKFDPELLEFLKFTNGASILDYCFMGFMNSRLGIDLDKFMLSFWSSQQQFAGEVLGFITTSASETFGYLINVTDSEGRHPIVYTTYDEKLYLIGSSFNHFMDTFIKDIDDTLKTTQEAFPMEVEKENWPLDLSHWVENDSKLREISFLPEIKKIGNLITPI